MKRLVNSHLWSHLALGLSIVAATTFAEEPGALYTMDNSADGNHVLAFHRTEDGGLMGVGVYTTGGEGAGTALASQGSVLLSGDGRWVFVCNAGSHDISVFSVASGQLRLRQKIESGGRLPLSLTLRHNLLYVLNAGGSAGDKDNIAGFAFVNGMLVPVPGSAQPLSADNTGPAQVSFSQEGGALIVTERTSNLIEVFALGDDGLATDRKVFQSVGVTPFGFGVGRHNRVFVSEAAGGMANASSASSYGLSDDGNLMVISGAVSTEQTAACWLLCSRDGRFVYTANAGSGSISGFKVGHEGTLELLAPDGRTGVTGDGSHPTDMVESRDRHFLYSLNNGNGTISGFRLERDGALESRTVVGGIPTSASGLAGR